MADTSPSPRPVLAVLSDLLFRSKIDEVARRLGLPLRVARSPEQLERHLAASSPVLALVDLEEAALDPAAAIRRLKTVAEPPRVIGFAGHTNVGAIRAGRDAGADAVLARSALTAQLPSILAEVAASNRP
jgi:DNA-binding NarL/FixJ family response regulator